MSINEDLMKWQWATLGQSFSWKTTTTIQNLEKISETREVTSVLEINEDQNVLFGQMSWVRSWEDSGKVEERMIRWHQPFLSSTQRCWTIAYHCVLSPGAVELNQESDSALVPSEVRNATEVEAADWWALLLLEELQELKNSMRRSRCPTHSGDLHLTLSGARMQPSPTSHPNFICKSQAGGTRVEKGEGVKEEGGKPFFFPSGCKQWQAGRQASLLYSSASPITELIIKLIWPFCMGKQSRLSIV